MSDVYVEVKMRMRVSLKEGDSISQIFDQSPSGFNKWKFGCEIALPDGAIVDKVEVLDYDMKECK